MPHNQNFYFKLTSDAKIQPAITGRADSCFWLFLTGHALRPIFFALIGQNLTGEFVRKIYAASWNLFTLTAEADRVLCQLVMFLTVFFHWMHKMKFSCYQEFKHSLQLALQKWEPAGCICDFGHFFNGLAKSPRVLRSSWILNECNLYFKIVKYCILSEVCILKKGPHSTASPQMWCIKSIKGWFTRLKTC